MLSHNNASKESQHLCHRLFEELQHFLPNVARSESKDTCALYVPGKNRFAYVYHRSEGGFIRVYFRGDVSVAPALQKQIPVQVRPNFHAVIHRRNPPVDIETIRKSIKKKSRTKFST